MTTGALKRLAQIDEIHETVYVCHLIAWTIHSQSGSVLNITSLSIFGRRPRRSAVRLMVIWSPPRAELNFFKPQLRIFNLARLKIEDWRLFRTFWGNLQTCGSWALSRNEPRNYWLKFRIFSTVGWKIENWQLSRTFWGHLPSWGSWAQWHNTQYFWPLFCKRWLAEDW